jgi:hypothetical protein
VEAEFIFAGLSLGAATGLVKVRLRLAGFFAQRPEGCSGLLPKSDRRSALVGGSLVEGMICRPAGRSTSQFVNEAHASWSGDRSAISETFRNPSGNFGIAFSELVATIRRMVW